MAVGITEAAKTIQYFICYNICFRFNSTLNKPYSNLTLQKLYWASADIIILDVLLKYWYQNCWNIVKALLTNITMFMTFLQLTLSQGYCPETWYKERRLVLSMVLIWYNSFFFLFFGVNWEFSRTLYWSTQFNIFCKPTPLIC